MEPPVLGSASLGSALLEGEKPVSGELSPFSPSERALVSKCIDAIEHRAAYLEEKGLTKRNFVFGVCNSLFVAWSLGALPQHFWIIYLFEVAVLFPIRWHHMVNAKPLKEHLYWLDFCWIANFCGVTALFLLFTCPNIDDGMRRRAFSVAWGVGNGPLLLATGVLGNALLFHDADNTASVLIHLFPSLVMFVLGWRHETVHAAWPHTFRIDYLDSLDPWKDIYLHAAMAYWGWWVCYTLWLLTCAMKAPRRGYDTIFHANMRGAVGDKICKATGRKKEDQAQRAADNDFTTADAVLYMLGHAVGSNIGILVSLLCFINEWVHISIIGLMAYQTVSNAASRYTFYMLRSYSHAIRKELGIPLNRRGSALGMLPS